MYEMTSRSHLAAAQLKLAITKRRNKSPTEILAAAITVERFTKIVTPGDDSDARQNNLALIHQTPQLALAKLIVSPHPDVSLGQVIAATELVALAEDAA
jgi:hypothetical protein